MRRLYTTRFSHLEYLWLRVYLRGTEFLKEWSMSVQVAPAADEEPPATRAQHAAGKASQYFLYFLCLASIAVFPLGLVYKIFTYFFS
jgi:hypothetical protein